MWDRDAVDAELEPVTFLADRYVEMLTTGRDAIARTLHVLADTDSFPLVFHCAAGKDRTGVVAAVVLSLLGVSDDDIAADYSLSRLGMPRFKEWVIATYPEAADAMTDQPAAFLAAPAEAMHLFLERLRAEFGSMHDYVAGLGVTDATLDAVKENLLA
jgi:protein tyrosine/serine phosphatase